MAIVKPLLLPKSIIVPYNAFCGRTRLESKYLGRFLVGKCPECPVTDRLRPGHAVLTTGDRRSTLNFAMTKPLEMVKIPQTVRTYRKPWII